MVPGGWFLTVLIDGDVYRFTPLANGGFHNAELGFTLGVIDEGVHTWWIASSKEGHAVDAPRPDEAIAQLMECVYTRRRKET